MAYKQMFLKQQKDNKLAPKYYGSYKMLQRIGSMAYKLELLQSLHVHPMFHVSFLNKVIVAGSQFILFYKILMEN